ncbi:ATPase [Taibaiella sp. KBW10]|uniref:helicase HerA-like domain-containing protein n=1 Tax=Taibaiella sp. KBW10 TaxID=2153357 RepID=UPI000F5972A6|nr:helicase HerA-like domain-containing protein [Taibaiella sp. KBW10]RQO29931.1 ATPase [Taibaiella sp. KBW10]
MSNKETFISDVTNGYTFKGASFRLGSGMLDGTVVSEAVVNIPLKTMNRHGLIAGATGTGKTKTLQLLAEGLSDASVSVLMMDIKGDLSGIAAAGQSNKIIEERYAQMGLEWQAKGYPVELLSLSQEKGVRLRATVTEYGAVLLSKVLDLNDNQSGLLAMLFKYADDQHLPILDLKDLVKLLQYAAEEGNGEISQSYGNISKASLGTILRKVIELQNQGADHIFGERSFEIDDLLRISDDGRGLISILRVTDIQDKPKLFSTFMLQLLAELYANLPEEGDMEQPKLVMFIDEAHLIFNEASKDLLQQIESIVKLIRSKGVGVIFCTQNPQDIPASVLSQLGLKIQHALRAFTANDRKAIKQASENYPDTNYYVIDETMTQMGIGEAFVTLLNEKGIPSPLVQTFLLSPASRMNILEPNEIEALVAESKLVAKYNQDIDSESAYELLNAKMQSNIAQEKIAPVKATRPVKEEPSMFEKVLNSAAGKQAQRSLTRGLLDVVMKMFK